jgi:RNA polymerase sigma-70 factor (ECF subfamily)
VSAALVRAVYEAYGPALHRYLMQRLVNAETARDLAQETYLRLLRVEHAELIRAPQAYVFRLAANLVCELYLRERRDVVRFDSRLVDNAAECVSDPIVADPAERIDIDRQLDFVLAQLPPQYAAILVMKKRDGRSIEEIAHELSLSVHTVKKYLCRALALCRNGFRITEQLSVLVKRL